MRPRSKRLFSLDVFRGLTVAGMLLVNHPGAPGAAFAPLRHAPWHGCTPADLVFPFFLFIVGVTTVLSIDARRARGESTSELQRHVLRRGGALIALGLLVAVFPFFPLTRFTEVRIPGVLQRIGLCYLVAGTIVLRTGWRTQAGWLVAALLGYWALITRGPLEPPEATVAAALDRWLMDGHLWIKSKTWDPEGVLSTIPAVGTTLCGALAAAWLRSDRPLDRRALGLALGGLVATAAGAAWGLIFPINKALWTSSYVLLTGGLAAMTLAGAIWAADLRGWRRPFAALLPFGLNPTIAFVGSSMAARLIYSVVAWPGPDGQPLSLAARVHAALFAVWLSPAWASLGFSLLMVSAWYLILKALSDRGVILKI